MSTTTATLNATRLAPGITVNDLEKSVAFYEGLGLAVDQRWEEEGKLLGVMLKGGNAELGLTQDDWKKGKDRVKGVGMRIWIQTRQDIDDLAAKAKAAGVAIESGPEAMPWGGRSFAVSDPDGFKVSISSEYQSEK